MAEKANVTYVFPGKSSFVQQDLEILERNFEVSTVDVGKKKTNFAQKIPIVIKIVQKIAKSDVSFAWFANNHAYAIVKLSKIFGKKSIVVVGGFEVAEEKEIGYGGLLDPILRKRIEYVLNNADLIISVSKFSEKEIRRISKPNNLKLIYNSVDTNKFQFKPEKENVVITVCMVNQDNVVRKGLNTFVDSAAYLPETRFVLIGKWIDESIDDLKKKASGNVEFTGFVSDEELIKWYQKAKVYCQLSYYESFGVTITEAMACECIPVVSDRGAVSEVAGDTGFVVPYGDPEATAEAIKKALSSKNGPAARKRVLELFNTEERERKLVNSIYEILE